MNRGKDSPCDSGLVLQKIKKRGVCVPIFLESRKDWYLVVLVVLLAIGANLPGSITEKFYVNNNLLLMALAAIVVVSLVRYLKFTLLLVVVILAIGANLPGQLAEELGVDRNLLLLSLGAMVCISFANKFLKLDPGLEKKSGSSATHGATALFKAISYGRLSAAESLLQNGVNVNVKTVSQITPLILAASKGYTDIVKLLLDYGADPEIKGRGNMTAIQFAEAQGFTRVAELLETAARSRRKAGAEHGAALAHAEVGAP